MSVPKRAFTLVECLLAIALAIFLLYVLVLVVQAPRGPHPEVSCKNYMKQIAVALHIYQSSHGEFPPAFTTDEAGNRLHSWRTLILPYLGHENLYERVDFTKPWDDPVNAEARAAGAELHEYRCPSADLAEGHTTYLAIVGPGFLFSGSKPTKLEEITDAPGRTLIVIDAPSEHAVHWMSPLDADKAMPQGLSDGLNANHPGRVLGIYADGSVHPIELSAADATSRRAMLTISDND